jgi:glycine/D-amino acid oxidase-like deaminating enzyme
MSSPIVVVGAGVIGLTTAIRLLQSHYPVLILASHLPTDPLLPTYASSAAGAHHLSFADDKDERQQMLDRRTFDVMWEEEEREGEGSGLMRLTQVEYYGEGAETHIKFFESLPDVRLFLFY